jgi:hypothetical protein
MPLFQNRPVSPQGFTSTLSQISRNNRQLTLLFRKAGGAGDAFSSLKIASASLRSGQSPDDIVADEP